MQVNQQQPHAPSASAIHWAATKGDLRALRWLVEYEGVDPSAKDTSSHHCETPLFRAAGANHPEVIEYLVDYARVDVNQRDDSNHTPLSWTCYFPDNLESVQLLLEKGADPTIATHDGRTPLMIAAYAGYSNVVRLLLRHPLSAYLLEARTGPESECHKGCTPLLLAAQGKRWETVGVLLGEGADPTAEDGEGRSVLQLVKEGGGPRKLVYKIEHFMDDAARCEVLHKARTIGEASQAMTKAVLQTYLAPFSRSRSRREQQRGDGTPFSSLHDRHARCVVAAPSFLKGRVAKGDNIPCAFVVQGAERPWEGVLLEERAKAVAAYVIAPPPLDAEAQQSGAGMPQQAYKMLMAMLVPRFLERKDEQRIQEAVRGAGGLRRRGSSLRRGLSVGGSSEGGEVASTVAVEDEGVEESKGKGMREPADVKAARRLRRGGSGGSADGGVDELGAAMAAKATLNGGRAMQSGWDRVAAAVKGGQHESPVPATAAAVETLQDKARATPLPSGWGRMVRQLKAQQQSQKRQQQQQQQQQQAAASGQQQQPQQRRPAFPL